jgi:TM2 domain-containing membrane protein YozV
MANLNSNYATKQLLSGYAAIIFGAFGAHKFILGYTAEGVLTLIISIIGGYFSYGFTFLIMQMLGLIEGLIYLNKNHEEFVDNYLVNKQGWF